jgi:hypothetical protein
MWGELQPIRTFSFFSFFYTYNILEFILAVSYIPPSLSLSLSLFFFFSSFFLSISLLSLILIHRHHLCELIFFYSWIISTKSYINIIIYNHLIRKTFFFICNAVFIFLRCVYYDLYISNSLLSICFHCTRYVIYLLYLYSIFV